MDDPEAQMLSSKYFEPHELTPLLKSKESLSFFHLNISSLPFHFEEFSTLLSTYKLPVDLLGITESRLRINKLPLKPIQLPGYNFESTPTESTKGGTAIYIKKTLNYKLRKDLIIYKPNQLESTFIEVIQIKKTFIAGCIYRHPSVEISDFNKYYLSNLIEKLSLENKKIVLLGDFNVDLLNYDSNHDVSDFLDTMHSNLLLPHITSPTRITAKSSTLIDNIFSNFFDSSFISDNIVTALSDHHAQFLVIANQTSFDFEKQDHLYRDFSQIESNKAAIKNQLESIDWKGVLRLNCKDANLSSNLFFQKIDKLINFWAPLQVQLNTRKISKSKLWITKGILKSICTKNRLYKKMCRSKDPSKRNEIETKVKNYKKFLLKLTRARKANHYNKFFLENKLNLFKTWQGIREIINISKKANKVISCIQNVNNMTINSPKEIAEEFNKHSISIAKKVEKKLIKPNVIFPSF